MSAPRQGDGRKGKRWDVCSGSSKILGDRISSCQIYESQPHVSTTRMAMRVPAGASANPEVRSYPENVRGPWRRRGGTAYGMQAQLSVKPQLSPWRVPVKGGSHEGLSCVPSYSQSTANPEP